MKPSFPEFVGQLGAGKSQSLMFDHVQKAATFEPRPVEWVQKASGRSDPKGRSL